MFLFLENNFDTIQITMPTTNTISIVAVHMPALKIPPTTSHPVRKTAAIIMAEIIAMIFVFILVFLGERFTSLIYQDAISIIPISSSGVNNFFELFLNWLGLKPVIFVNWLLK